MRALRLPLVVSLAVHVVVTALVVAPARETGLPELDPPPQIAGDTFELPAPETVDLPLANASPSPEELAPPSPDEEGDGPAHPRPPVRGHASRRPSHPGRPSAGRAEPGTAEGTPGATGTSTLYGAVGERSASDLATAFTRGFPQAASADPVWRSAPPGSAGHAEVVLTLDDTGHIQGMQVLGTPSAALSSAIRRTFALIKGRPFVARAKVTRLELTASVSADAVHDGLHGDVFAIGGSFAGGEGNAFFALAIGRRIDVRVRAR